MIISYCLSIASIYAAAYDDILFNEKTGTVFVILVSRHRLHTQVILLVMLILEMQNQIMQPLKNLLILLHMLFCFYFIILLTHLNLV